MASGYPPKRSPSVSMSAIGTKRTQPLAFLGFGLGARHALFFAFTAALVLFYDRVCGAFAVRPTGVAVHNFRRG
jgi:hypothetical protein